MTINLLSECRAAGDDHYGRIDAKRNYSALLRKHGIWGRICTYFSLKFSDILDYFANKFAENFGGKIRISLVNVFLIGGKLVTWRLIRRTSLAQVNE